MAERHPLSRPSAQQRLSNWPLELMRALQLQPPRSVLALWSKVQMPAKSPPRFGCSSRVQLGGLLENHPVPHHSPLRLAFVLHFVLQLNDNRNVSVVE